MALHCLPKDTQVDSKLWIRREAKLRSDSDQVCEALNYVQCTVGSFTNCLLIRR